ncbi:MAG: histidine kinase [Bacteroidia bacterium]|nr:histidine kinase [Bacteroidia bacterium]
MLPQLLIQISLTGLPENLPPPGRIMSVLFFMLIWLLSSMLHLLGRYQRSKEHNAQLKVEKSNAELSWLKAQINPHFLFNSLNSIYSLALTQSRHTADAVVKLSDIMRYVTQEAHEDWVPLEKELAYITNYVELQQLRCNEKLLLRFEKHGDAAPFKIAPLLLISFIENAFKYGVSNHHSSSIAIVIKIRERQLEMQVENKIVHSFSENGTATGINNTKQRLQLQYPGRHEINTNCLRGYYQVNLKLFL